MKWKVLILLLILISAFIVRFYRLGQTPGSLDWDEASIGWNAYSLLKTGTDEYGIPHPVSIRSFNDYKPPLYVYASVPSIAAFGLNEWSVRFPSALAGIVSVLATYFLVRNLLNLNNFTLKQSNNEKISLLSALFLAVSPWSVQFSRVAFETNLSLMFFIIGATFFVWYLHRQHIRFAVVSVLSFVLSMYAYHSTRLIVPLFLSAVVIFYHRFFLSKIKDVFLLGLFAILLLFPLIHSTITVGSLEARFSDVSIFRSTDSYLQTSQAYLKQDLVSRNLPGVIFHSPFVVYSQIFAKNYLDHFNIDFLFLTGEDNNRHHAPDVGVLLLFDLPFALYGLCFLIRSKPIWSPVVFIWFLVAPVASALTSGTPHAVRAMLYLPTWQIFAAVGLIGFVRKIPTRRSLASVFIGSFFFLNLFYYFNQYFVQMPVEYAQDWQYGYKQVVGEVVAREKNYDKVYMSALYDQPYIYFLFYGRISPVVKNTGFFYVTLDKYTFKNFCDSPDPVANNRDMIVLAGPESSCPQFRETDRILFPDGKLAFKIGEKT